jgi:hypothetical protein
LKIRKKPRIWPTPFFPEQLHRHLDRIARQLCHVIRHFPALYHWSLMQVEYATDIVSYRQKDLAPLYEELARTAIRSVKPAQVATFLGRHLSDLFQDELGNDFHTRIEGTRLKHLMGKAAIKMYDKLALILRIKTTTNDVSFFQAPPHGGTPGSNPADETGPCQEIHLQSSDLDRHPVHCQRTIPSIHLPD